MAEALGTVRAARAQEHAVSAASVESAAKPDDDAKSLQAPNRADVREQASQDAGTDDQNKLGVPFLKNLLLDQKSIWSSPSHLRWADGSWLFPLATATGILLATDRSAAMAIPNDPAKLNRYRSFSDFGVASLVGVGGGLYLWSKISHDDHQRETGVLAGEAAIDGLVTNQALQVAFGRDRPYQDQGSGAFFQRGSSFPSDHSAVAWSIASVIAHEYPGPLTQILAYGVATGVSASRIAGQEHFPSDVLVGSAIGWLIGRQVYRAHHDPGLGGNAVGDLGGYKDEEDRRDRRHMGSPFVPIDSWVYPAFERLAALGYVHTAIMGQKPWTRIECARLTEEADEALEQDVASGNGQGAAGIEARLQQEFAYELGLLDGGRNLRANVESVYARAVSISGPALTDGFHFGQTVGYDFGRPFERGTNGQVGGSFSAEAGPLTVYIRTEYQHAPSAPALSDNLRNFISNADQIPLSDVQAGPVAAINRAEILDAYAAVNLGNWQFAVGRQTLSWGPMPDPMLWSDNAPPVSMIRLVDPEPFHLPGFLKYLGPIRLDQFFGRLDGHTYVPEPFIYGQKLNFKPFPFLEIGFGRTTTIGGVGGYPLTLGNFARSFVGWNRGKANDHGESQAEQDWTFTVPGIRHYVVLYGDAFAADDVLPALEPARNPWHPGIYITRFPGIPKLDFHMEGVSTEAPGLSVDLANHGNFNYWYSPYREGFTNDSFLIGNTVGREGRSIQSWVTYWLSSTNTLQFIYRHNSVNSDFIPGGGAWQDYAVRNETYLRNGFYVKAELQYENISHYPILFDGRQRNVTAILELGFDPQQNVHARKNDP